MDIGIIQTVTKTTGSLALAYPYLKRLGFAQIVDDLTTDGKAREVSTGQVAEVLALNRFTLKPTPISPIGAWADGQVIEEVYLGHHPPSLFAADQLVLVAHSADSLPVAAISRSRSSAATGVLTTRAFLSGSSWVMLDGAGGLLVARVVDLPSLAVQPECLVALA